ncbi:membrane integrity-associated transporter subunit PqiC [Achromobacter sp. GG226]|uniref:ABC-type transport auxiliary lipoprotein family protein n=1 Tax=Verticiella alkaliphila TaxID=2779529 RepID=UPI001C0E5714|nr:ABC-type transport auxiliary lipoprotein family protein [Verticiella sp. GG226]MBU4610718.1 membrane integrity-associated transporter subunit PqiC [Verticiella sp. GG226]
MTQGFARNAQHARSATRWLLAAGCAIVLAGCGSLGQVAPQPQVLDVGTTQTPRVPLPPRAPLAVPAVEAAPLLRSQGVVWREKGSLSPQAYASYQWASPPAELLGQRLRERLSTEGPVLPGNTGGLPELRVTLERFEQVFDPAAAVGGAPVSAGDIALRAVLTQDGRVLDQLRLALSVPAASGDAPGGARALRSAVDAVSDNLAEWLSQQPSLAATGRPGVR